MFRLYSVTHGRGRCVTGQAQEKLSVRARSCSSDIFFCAHTFTSTLRATSCMISLPYRCNRHPHRLCYSGLIDVTLATYLSRGRPRWAWGVANRGVGGQKFVRNWIGVRIYTRYLSNTEYAHCLLYRNQRIRPIWTLWVQPSQLPF